MLRLTFQTKVLRQKITYMWTHKHRHTDYVRNNKLLQVHDVNRNWWKTKHNRQACNSSLQSAEIENKADDKFNYYPKIDTVRRKHHVLWRNHRMLWVKSSMTCPCYLYGQGHYRRNLARHKVMHRVQIVPYDWSISSQDKHILERTGDGHGHS